MPRKLVASFFRTWCITHIKESLLNALHTGIHVSHDKSLRFALIDRLHGESKFVTYSFNEFSRLVKVTLAVLQ